MTCRDEYANPADFWLPLQIREKVGRLYGGRSDGRGWTGGVIGG